MILLFEQNYHLTIIKNEKYDITLEKLNFTDTLGNTQNVMLSLKSKKAYDLQYILHKIGELKYSKLQIGYLNNNIQISHTLDIKNITVNNLFDNVRLMEQLI